MTEEELKKIISSHEADRVEFTVSTDNTSKFSEAVCSFSNDLPNHKLPGYLLVGLDNQGNCNGLKVTDQLMQNLAALRNDGNIQPLPEISVEKISLADGDVAVVTVQPSKLPPVRYKGRVCIRVGPRRAYATEAEERRLAERRVSYARTFDAQPCLGITVEALSKAIFIIDYRQHAIAEEVISENNRSYEDQMASLRFFDLAENCPTNAGVILFGLDVRQSLPGAFIQFLRIAGNSFADSVSNEREINGDLLTVLRELDALTDAQLTQAPVTSSLLSEQMVEAYPRVAVRELLMNGIMHRDYSSTAPLRITWFDDRIEIQSPGGLYGEASRENFPRQTSYRNPIIAESLKALGYVNRYGRGVIRAQEVLRRNGSPSAEFEFDDGYVLAVIRKNI
jgi:ATP-dependent DNA helicase RecG